MRGHGGTGARRHGRTRARTHRGSEVLAAVVVGLTAVGCELEEVAIPVGREQVAVHAVLTLDTAATAQFVVVERTITGTAEIPDQDSLRGAPRPPLPISGAVVVVTRDDGDSVVYAEGAVPGVYELPRVASPGFVAAGREYRLRVDLPGGGRVSGRTRVPTMPVVSGLPADGAEFDRDRDTLRLSWTPTAGSKGMYVQVRPRDVQRRLTLVLFTDSQRVVLPGRLPLPVVSDTLPPSVWVAGTWQTVTVAAMDSNFFDHLRSASDPFTGGGYLRRLEGALGVFGAVAPVNRRLAVRAAVDHPVEGRYSLRMTVGTDSLVGEIELFVTRDRPEPLLVSGFVTAVRGIASETVRTPLVEGEGSGWLDGGVLHLRLTEGGERVLAVLDGAFPGTAPAAGAVRAPDGGTVGAYVLGRLP